MTETAAATASDSRVRLDGSPARWLLWMGVAALVGLVHVAVTVGAGILWPRDPKWNLPLNDTSMSVLGAEAFLRDSTWNFPLASTELLLSGGTPVSIVYTDSAPWIAILVKALGLGVNDVSVIGLVAVLSVVLQPVAMAMLLLAMGVRRAESMLAGIVLGALMPAWYLRLEWHVALASHWLVILALALAALAIRRELSWWIIGALAALGALSIGVHAYLFVMVAAVAAGALLSDVARVGRRAAPRAVAGFVLFLAASGIAAWVLGYGGGGGVGGFGRYSMNVLSPIVPQNSGLTQLLLGTSRYPVDATGGQYEGFNYLGGGILLCVGVAAIVLWRRRSNGSNWRPALPLVAAFVALTLFALSNKVYVRHTLVLNVPLPARVLSLFDEIRSSGRMFWPVAYMLLASAVLVLDRLPRRAVATTVLTAALLLQVIDTSVLRKELRATYRLWLYPSPAFDASTFQPGGALAGRSLRVLPNYLCTVYDHEIARQAALMVERGGGVVEGGPVARFDPSLCGRDDLDRALLDRRPERLDLLMTRSIPPEVLDSVRQVATCTDVQGAVLCEHGSRGTSR